MNKKLREKGITLISLIMTVIILLILVSITMNKILENEGIITKIQKVSGIYGENVPKEEIEVKKMEIMSEAYASGTLVYLGIGENGELLNNGETIEGVSVTDGKLSSSFDKSGSYLGKALSGVVVLQEGITIIGAASFGIATNITTVIIPDGVTTIENEAFYGCKSLESIIFPETLTSIGAAAFMSCTSLKEIYIPASVIEIGDMTFYGCESLEKVTIICDGESNLSNESKNYPWGIDETIIEFVGSN